MRYAILDPLPLIAARAWSQREVARRLDLEAQTWYGYLHGRRPCPISVGLELAQLLDLDHERAAALLHWFAQRHESYRGAA